MCQVSMSCRTWQDTLIEGSIAPFSKAGLTLPRRAFQALLLRHILGAVEAQVACKVRLALQQVHKDLVPLGAKGDCQVDGVGKAMPAARWCTGLTWRVVLGMACCVM